MELRPKMFFKSFGGQAPPWPAGGRLDAPQTPELECEERKKTGKEWKAIERKMGEGKNKGPRLKGRVDINTLQYWQG
jgi:hypothetical protein